MILLFRASDTLRGSHYPVSIVDPLEAVERPDSCLDGNPFIGGRYENELRAPHTDIEI